MPSQKTKSKFIFLTPVPFSLTLFLLQCFIYYQLLFTIFSHNSVSVNAVYIFPLRLSPKYYIPGLLEPPKSSESYSLHSLHKALKYLHTSKSAAEVTNAFLRKISEDSTSAESSPTAASTILSSTTIATRKTTRNNNGNKYALPLNEQITGRFADQLRSSKPEDTEFEEKLVLIVFKLPVKKTKTRENKENKEPPNRERQRQRRYKRQRPSLQFYQRSADPTTASMPPSSRSMSIGNKIRSWWEGSTGSQQRPTSSTPKFQPTYKYTYNEGPVPYNSERPFVGNSDRPWAYRSTTARTSNNNINDNNSNNMLYLDKFFWKNTSPQPKRPNRPGPGPPPSQSTGLLSGLIPAALIPSGLLPAPSTTPYLSFGNYFFNGPGCQPRGPKLILCTTDRIEHLSHLLEKFMHYHERNNLQFAKQYIDDDDDDYNDSRIDESNYNFRIASSSGKNSKKKKKSKKFYGVSPSKHPSVVVVAMNNRDEEVDDHEDHPHHEDSDEFAIHHDDSLERIHNDSSHEQDEHDHELEKDPLVMIVKEAGKRPEKLIQASKGKSKSNRTKRKLTKNHNIRKNTSPSVSEEIASHDYFQKKGNRDRYIYFLENKKKILRDEHRDRYEKNAVDEKLKETEAEYRRLNMLMELIKKYQELI